MAFGIICEYNPFHNGHLHQINKIKEMSSEPIVCVMSGNFTQRGEVAICDKYARAQMAISCGADLVVELPIPFCISSAEYFARAGIDILYSLGVDKLCFGSESGDKKKILEIASVASSLEFRDACAAASKEMDVTGTYFDILSQMSGHNDIRSNDILGVEYAKAIITRGYAIEIYPIVRDGAAYLENSLSDGENPSASAVRSCIESHGIEGVKDHIPRPALKILKSCEISNLKYANDSWLLPLRLYRKDGLDLAISDIGLMNRIISTAEQSTSYAEFESAIQTKKYTSSTLRRTILYMLLGICKTDLDAKVEYTTLLGATLRGRELLAKIRNKENVIPVVTKPSSAPECRQRELDRRADALYTMCFESKKSAGVFVKKNPYIV